MVADIGNAERLAIQAVKENDLNKFKDAISILVAELWALRTEIAKIKTKFGR